MPDRTTHRTSDPAAEVALVVWLSIDGDGRPAGTVARRDAEAQPHPYSGWLELMAEISRLVGPAPADDRPGR